MMRSLHGPKVLVTGASGFIGSHFVRFLLERVGGVRIRALARHSKARNLLRLTDSFGQSFAPKHVELVYGDLTQDISGLCEGVDLVVHFAAKSFVDHSVQDPTAFVLSNVVGTQRLLEEARKYKVKRFVLVSTDEVYGPVVTGRVAETSPLNPTNPYAASKAAAEVLAISYAHTYRVPVLITRGENTYGPWQHTQKVLPTFIRHALRGSKLPVYGDGLHARQWLYVTDHCSAIWLLCKADVATDGNIFNVSGNTEKTNLDLAKEVLAQCRGDLDDWLENIEFIDEKTIRPYHDLRYAMDSSKLQELGWKPEFTFAEGLRETVNWYKDNLWWFS